MNLPTFFIVAVFFLMMACASGKRGDNPQAWSGEEITDWFEGKDWLGKTTLQPDPSIDQKQFASRYHQNKVRWNKAFDFLKNKDLSAIEVGNHEIIGKDVFAIVSLYNSKNHEDAQYESHKIYTDLQYVVSGTEYIGLTDLSSTKVKTAYNDERDIIFYDAEKGRNLTAIPGKFFIFFPDNVHRPGMKVEDNVPVKKVVIKVKN
ncbi:MAG: YhcH/YjgK/YiaL family protein [Cyclobacteriaceae bacterium]